MSAPLVVALTGQSGSGKSQVGRILASRGVPVVDSDRTARDVVQPGTPCLAALAAEFSDDILLPDGSLDRKKLGALCFADDRRRRRLNEITHPHILAALKADFERLGREGHRLVVVEAPALFESGLDRLCGRIVLVTAPHDDKLGRIVARDSLTREGAVQRLAGQYPEVETAKRADYILDNSGTLEELEDAADTLLRQLSAWADEAQTSSETPAIC